MISIFSDFGGRDLRPNPHSIWVGRDLSRLSLGEKESIAEAIGDLEYRVWSAIAPHFVQGADSFLSTMAHNRDVLLAVSYAEPEDEFGPYTSYFIAVEDGPRSVWAQLYERETGRPFHEFLRQLPSENPKFFYREDQTRAGMSVAKREHRQMMDAVYDYMQDEGLGFATYARASTTYRLMKEGKQGRMVIVAEQRIPNFYGPGDDSVMVVGYYVPHGTYRPGMIESTRDR